MAETYVDLEREVQAEEALEDQLERNWEREDIERFSAEVLFCV
jgi:uncharacterized protein HemY